MAAVPRVGDHAVGTESDCVINDPLSADADILIGQLWSVAVALGDGMRAHDPAAQEALRRMKVEMAEHIARLQRDLRQVHGDSAVVMRRMRQLLTVAAKVDQELGLPLSGPDQQRLATVCPFCGDPDPAHMHRRGGILR